MVNKDELALWSEYIEWVKEENKPLLEMWEEDIKASEKRAKEETEKRERINKRNLEQYKKDLEAYNKLSWYKKRSMPQPHRPFTWDRLPMTPLYWDITPALKRATYENFLTWQLEHKLPPKAPQSPTKKEEKEIQEI